MATPQANKRVCTSSRFYARLLTTPQLTREYKAITTNPPPYITAHPSEKNILEWHYLLTGPPATPYEGGQYWGTLVFPPDYPFKPPAIRMMTPSGRFQTSTRLCLSISDFHPKSFNPAWEVSTILIGLLSFMTSEEMTTGSIPGTERERKLLAQSSRWWNSTGGGSGVRSADGRIVHVGTIDTSRKVGLGDAGHRFRSEWPETDEENWKWMDKVGIDPVTGKPRVEMQPQEKELAADATTSRRRTTQQSQQQQVVVGGSGGVVASAAVVARGEGWVRRNKVWVGLVVVVAYVLLARALE